MLCQIESCKHVGKRMGVLLLLLTAGCDGLLSVTNPASILEEDLNDPASVPALAAGVAGDFNRAYTLTAFWTSLLSDELLHTGTSPGYRNVSNGTVLDLPGGYNDLSKARWVADDAVRRFREILPDADTRSETASVSIYAGFALLLLADNYCEIPLDGGAAQTPESIYREAESRFTQGLTIAGAANDAELIQRAYAGRARTRLMLAEYAGARTDAQQVSDDFVFESIHSETPARENNEFPYQTVVDIRREISVHPIIYNDVVFQDDPRVPFINRGESFLGADGSSQFVEQRKYPVRSSNMEISSWQEARLIEAEAAARLGDLDSAIALIDEVRDAAGLNPYSGPETEAAVMDQIIYERRAELYLETQRLNDLRRFDDPYLQGRATCFPVSNNEVIANPNL